MYNVNNGKEKGSGKSMIVSAWKGGGSYGIRVGNDNAHRFFDKSWNHIEVKVGSIFYKFKLSPTFWSTCPEFRGKIIENWLKSQRLVPWPKGNPPKFELIPLGNNRFWLKKLSDLHRRVRSEIGNS